MSDHIEPSEAVRQLLNQARQIKNAAENNANSMAELLQGNLKRVGAYRLASLKKELRSFNIHTGAWRK